MEWRERLAIPEECSPNWLGRLRTLGVEEAVILSTCNRVELYAVGEEGKTPRTLREILLSGNRDPSLARCLYQPRDEAAIAHLFHVGAGLDSLVIGETEILGQLKRAYDTAREMGATGKLTNVLFQRALRLGKQVRAWNKLGEGPTSVASLAVMSAERLVGSLKECRVLVVGAGTVAESAVRSFHHQGVQQLRVVNRTLSRAEELARPWGGEARPWTDLTRLISESDVVLCSTGAPRPILTLPLLEESLRSREERRLLLIDIAVPRDVDPAVGSLKNVHLYNMDDLQGLVSKTMEKRAEGLHKSTALVQAITKEFVPWYTAWQRGEPATLSHESALIPTFLAEAV